MKQNKEKEKWVNEALHSLEGIKRATPPTDLFDQIEQEIENTEAVIIPIKSRWLSAAVTVALICLNVIAVQQYNQQEQGTIEETVVIDNTYSTLFSDYQIYE